MPLTLINGGRYVPDPYIPVQKINIFVWFVKFLFIVKVRVVKNALQILRE